MKTAVKKLNQYANVLLLVLLCLIAACFSKSFFSVRNLTNILKQSCILGILTVGLSNVLISGHMDLSIGAQMSFTGLMAISLQTVMPVGLAIVCALAIGCALGALNGLLVSLSHANSGQSLMITYGTNLLFSAMSLIYTEGFILEGSESAFYNSIGIGTIGKYVSYAMILFAVLAVVMWIAGSKTRYGRVLHMIGYNETCVKLSGQRTGRYILSTYVMMGFISAVAAVVLTSRVSSGNPASGNGYEMDAIIAAVLGGVSLSGGTGSAARAALGAITLQVLSNAMNLIGFGTYDQTIVKGVVLIFAIAFDVLNRRKEARA